MNEVAVIQSVIYEIRGQRVMLDFDLATLYHVETRVLNQAVKRNIERFPSDFMFQLAPDEWAFISSQSVMGSRMKRPNSALAQLQSNNPQPRRRSAWAFTSKFMHGVCRY